MGTGNGPGGTIVWGIEIKKIDDVVGSMQNGRLVEQIGKMQEDYDYGHRYLLVEGNFRANRTTGKLEQCKRTMKNGKWIDYWATVKYGNKQEMMYTHYISWLMSILIGSATMYLHTTTRQETADVVTCIAREYDKPWEDRKSLKVFNDSQVPGLLIPTVPMCVARNMAEGVGWDKASKAAEHFKTVKAMVNATVEEWKKVDGFDKVLAQRMIDGATQPHIMKRRTRRKR
jgi:ERCC4-type nuclease